MNLRLGYIGADEAGDHRHAQIIMKSLGIKYKEAIPGPTGDCWVFRDVDEQTLPETLPDYIQVIDWI